MTHTAVAQARFAKGGLRVGSIISRAAAVAQGLSVLGWAALSLVALIVFSTLGEAVIAHAAFQDLRRRPVSLAESSNVVFRRLVPMLGFAFVAPFLGIVIASLLAAAFGVSSIIVGGGAELLLMGLGMGLGLCLLIIP